MHMTYHLDSEFSYLSLNNCIEGCLYNSCLQEMWQQRVENYWSLLGPKVKPDTIRNIMDMKANFGSFAAALKDKDVWAMNVVPHDGPSTLKIIYDRGLIGSNHDWYVSSTNKFSFHIIEFYTAKRFQHGATLWCVMF